MFIGRERRNQYKDFLVVQWPRHRAPNAGGVGSIPGQRIGSPILQLQIPSDTNKIQHGRINKYLKKKSLERSQSVNEEGVVDEGLGRTSWPLIRDRGETSLPQREGKEERVLFSLVPSPGQVDPGQSVLLRTQMCPQVGKLSSQLSISPSRPTADPARSLGPAVGFIVLTYLLPCALCSSKVFDWLSI